MLLRVAGDESSAKSPRDVSSGDREGGENTRCRQRGACRIQERFAVAATASWFR